MKSDTISVVLRFANVKMSRVELENLVGAPLDRFEQSDPGSAYGQINLPETSDWSEISAAFDGVGNLQASITGGKIGRPSADFCTFISDASKSFHVPAEVVVAIGRAGFDLEVSTYQV